MTRTHTSALLPIAPGEVWRVLSDPGRWPEWEPAVAHAGLDELRVTAEEPERLLGVTLPRRGGPITVTWTLEPSPSGTRLTQVVEVDGPLGPVVSRGVAADLDGGFTDATVRLARLAGARPDPALPRVVIAGGSGSLGRLLAARLFALGHEVRIITRRRDPLLPHAQEIWDGRTVGDWATALRRDDDGPVALVNLAGKLVDVRPTADNIAALRSSRVDATRALVEASRGLERPLAAWLQASTTAIWSDAGERRITESSALPDPGLPQMTGVARPWEESVEGAATEHLVLLRTSIVLDRQSPALQTLARLTRAGLGGRVGTGYQWFSWIHHEDWVRVAVAALGLDLQVSIPDGPLVAAAPGPLRNADLMAALRRHLHRPAAPPTPAPLLRIGAIGLRSDPALALTGRHCTSEVLADAGFTFVHPDIDAALDEIYG